ncbi:MAG TPA: TIR domain-containing protein, partial [Pseudonocardiaceae bacterium]|nr:TIR domain-containing protein [Pseudonocardiaceae bacterium]
MPLSHGSPDSNSDTGASHAVTFAANRKAVMVIYGHDLQAKDALFDWLRAIGLQPREWNQLITGTGAASPYIGQVLDHAFEQAQAVIALFTPDEHVLPAGAAPGDPDIWRLQARPNVLIEAGMALVTHPARTVLVLLGPQELPSDLAGRHYIRLSPADPAPLHDLASRLQRAGCDTDTTGTDWLKTSRFPNRDHIPLAPIVGDSTTAHPPLTPPPMHSPAQATSSHQAAAPRPGRLTRTLTGHTDKVRGVAFSPSGTLLATTSNDYTARLWDAATGKPASTLSGHTSGVWSVAFHPDGTLLATASEDHTARVWDLATGKPARTLVGHETRVYGVAFSPDGTLLATTSNDNTARLWDLATGQPARTLTGHQGEVYGVAFSPDGTLLATSSYDSTVRLWELATSGCIRILIGHTEPVLGVAFSPDGA